MSGLKSTALTNARVLAPSDLYQSIMVFELSLPENEGSLEIDKNNVWES